MKKYLLEIIVIILQLVLFYLLPILSSPTDIFGQVVLTIIVTFILSFILVKYSKYHFKYIYPLIVIVMYIPSMYMFYNNVLLYELYYFISSLFGTLLSLGLDFILKKKY